MATREERRLQARADELEAELERRKTTSQRQAERARGLDDRDEAEDGDELSPSERQAAIATTRRAS